MLVVVAIHFLYSCNFLNKNKQLQADRKQRFESANSLDLAVF